MAKTRTCDAPVNGGEVRDWDGFWEPCAPGRVKVVHDRVVDGSFVGLWIGYKWRARRLLSKLGICVCKCRRFLDL